MSERARAEQKIERAFEEWWGKDGRFIDPDTSDVSWFDKRKELCALAFRAAALTAPAPVAPPEAEPRGSFPYGIGKNAYGSHRFDCENCRVRGVVVDEDGCCQGCGHDARRVVAFSAPPEALRALVEQAIELLKHVHVLDCGAHYCRYCPAKSPAWEHTPHCPYEESQKRNTEARELRAQLTAALSTPPSAGWQGIETAPKDRPIDVWLGEADEEEVEFYCGKGTRRSTDWQWRDGKFRPMMGLQMPVVTVRPTHWMERPAPPAGPATE